MKIVLVGDYPIDEQSENRKGNIWGRKRYIDGLTDYISRIDDIELHVITLGSKTMHFKKGNLNIHVLKSMYGATKIIRIPFAFTVPIDTLLLIRKIVKMDADIIHAIGSASYSMAASVLCDKYPTLFTATEIIAESIKFGGKFYFVYGTLTLKQFQRHALSKIPYIILESSSIKNMISTRTFSKIYVVPDGIEFEKIEAIQPIFNIKPDIFFIGRLSKEKGIDILIEAISIVKKSIPNVSAYIAGSGSQENELKSLVKKLDLEDHVKFLGFIPEEEKYQSYKACKIVVIPSRWDASPITIYEAMACGKPVIASIATNSEILEDGITGLLFKSENVEDLADKIATSLKNEKLREKMGGAAKEKAKQYDWGKIAERTVEIYKEIIADIRERKDKHKKRGRIL